MSEQAEIFTAEAIDGPKRNSLVEVLCISRRRGLTSFSGPIVVT